jgi:hypothetical protein
LELALGLKKIGAWLNRFARLPLALHSVPYSSLAVPHDVERLRHCFSMLVPSVPSVPLISLRRGKRGRRY